MSTGKVRLGNVNNGVVVDDAPRAIVGGSNAGEGNLISGNGNNGIAIFNSDAVDILVAGNFIGTDITGSASDWATAAAE